MGFNNSNKKDKARPNYPNNEKQKYPRFNDDTKHYDFNQTLACLTAYIGYLENKIGKIVKDLPVICQDLDVSYYHNKKFTKKENQEIYNKTPRIVVNFEDISDNKEQNTSQYTFTKYIHNNRTYKVPFRRTTITIQAQNYFIASNYIRALSYMEIVKSFLSRARSFTYVHVGNTMQASFELSTLSLQKADTSNSSESKDNRVLFMCDLQIHLMSIDYEKVKLIVGVDDDGTEFVGDEERNILFNIITTDPDLTKTISEIHAPNNPDCACKDCKI